MNRLISGVWALDPERMVLEVLQGQAEEISSELVSRCE